MHHYPPPTRTLAAWTAGFVDGEGSVYIARQATRSARFGIVVTQSEVNDGERIMRWLQAEWGIGIVFLQRKVDRPGFYRAKGDQWVWSVNATREVEHLARCILPFSQVKRAKLEKAIDFSAGRSTHKSRWTPGEEALLRQHAGKTDVELAAMLGRGESAVRWRRRSLGIPAGRVQRNATYLA